jgi:hypothetical protein
MTPLIGNRMRIKKIRQGKLMFPFVLFLLLLSLFIAMATPAMADSSGPNNAGTGADVTGIGTITWTNPGYITADDTNYATASNVPINGGTTHYLQGTNYGFAIPSNATINGITVVINRQSSGVQSPFLRDNVISLVKAGVIQSTNRAATSTDWPTSALGTATYGGTSDLWDTAWTPADINNTNFGVVLSAINPNTGNNRTRNATVDYMQITVTYTPSLTVTINQASGQADPTNTSPINFTVVFSASVSNFITGDVTLTGTAGATTAIVTGSGTTYNVAVSGMTSSGTVIASIAAGVASASGTLNTASTSTDNTVTYDITRPTMTINQAAGQTDPTGTSPINFTVVFSETVTGFATGDVTLGGTAGATTGTVTGSGTTYNVAVSGMTSTGTVIASIAAGVAADTAGNTNTASTSTDNTVTFNRPNIAPVANNDTYDAYVNAFFTMAAPGVLSNDTDADGDTLAVGTPAPVSGPSHGTLDLYDDGSFLYTPATGYYGPDSFTYKANDGITDSNNATVNINVIGGHTVQTFYLPFPEDSLLTSLQAIANNATPSSPITTYISIAALSDNTIIYYDQWENGYDSDIANPSDVYSTSNLGGTQIWGDGNTANGNPPGITSDIINAGTVILLNNNVVTTTRQSVIDFDGGDKFASTDPVTVTRTSWAKNSSTMLAGCVEVFDYSNWGTDYRSPVGANIPDATDFQMFEYTSLSIMAGQPPQGKTTTTVNIDYNADGTYDTTLNLKEGESYLVNGGVYVGAHVTSDYPVQVDILSGDIGSNYESRDSAL